jgi:hypothetical protein
MANETSAALGHQLSARRVMEDDCSVRHADHNDIVQRGSIAPGSQTRYQRPTFSYVVAQILKRTSEDVGGIPLLLEVPLQILSRDAFSG